MSKILKFANTPAMQFEIAEDHIKRDDFPSAVQALRTGIGSGGDKGARIALGEAYLHAGLVVQSFETFVEAYCSGDRTGPCLFGLCRTAFLLGFDEDSGEYFKEIFIKNPSFTESMPEGAVEELGDAISEFSASSDPDRGFTFVGKNYQTRFDEDKIEMIRTNPEKVLPYFESFTKSSPLYEDARNYVALIYLLEGSPEIAMRECEKLMEEYPDSVFAMSTLIACYSALGLSEKEKEIADKIESAKVKDFDLLVKIALAMCQAGRHGDAVRYFEKLDDRKYEKNTLILLSIAYHNIGEKEKAKRTLRDAQKLYPKDSAYLIILNEYMTRRREEIEYAVTLTGGLALAVIAECRSWFGFCRSENDFDFDNLIAIMKSERNYRLLYWYITSQARCYDGDEAFMLYRLVQTGDERCIGFVLEIMRDFSVDPELKAMCARILLRESYQKEIHILYGARILSTTPTYPVGYEIFAYTEDKRAQLLTDAFACAYTEALLRGEGFERALCDEFDEARDKVLCSDKNKLRSPFSLGAVLFGKALKEDNYTEKELCDIFMISGATYKKYKKFLEEEND